MTHCEGPVSVCGCPACTRARHETSEAFLNQPTVVFPAEESKPSPFGSVHVVVSVEGQWALSLLTEAWSDEQKQDLLDGDRGAAEALYDAAVARSLAEPYRVEREHLVIRMRDGDMGTEKELRGRP